MSTPEPVPATVLNPDFRAGYAAIIGEPNVGKSTLLNSLLGQKISIVSKKPQTTRHKILGILSDDSHQIVFLDTPGILKPKYKLHEAMMKFAESAIYDADIILLMIDASNSSKKNQKEHELMFSFLKEMNKPVYLLINKIDLVDRQTLLELITEYSTMFEFDAVFPISALNKQGIGELRKIIVEQLPKHPPFYPLDSLSEQSEKFFVSEIIREKIFEQFREEIPYSTTVDIIEFKEHTSSEGEPEGHKRRKDNIEAEIYVERDSQKAILIGKNGKALKEIGIQARKDIEKLLGRPVFLRLYVKVREQWREDEAWLKRLGYSDR